MAQSLISRGANLDFQDAAGLTPAQRAAAQGHAQLAAWLQATQSGDKTVAHQGAQPSQRELATMSDGILADTVFRASPLSEGMPLVHLSPQASPIGSPSFGASPERNNGSGNDGDRGPDGDGLTVQNLAMLQDAFTTLSLKEKCLIRSGVAAMLSHQQSAMVDGNQASDGADDGGGSVGEGGGVESDVASVITESDVESLDMAMAMMGPEELVELEYEARVLQKNMKAWIM